MSLIRRIRAAVGIGVTWAVGWGVTGAVVFSGLWLALEPYQRARLTTFAAPADFRLAATGAAALVGLISGMLFALLLAAAERERDIDKVSGWRTALLGAVSSLGIFLLGAWATGALAGAAIPAAVFAAFGAVSASKTLWIARRGSLSAGRPDAAGLLSDDEGDGGRPGSGTTRARTR